MELGARFLPYKGCLYGLWSCVPVRSHNRQHGTAVRQDVSSSIKTPVIGICSILQLSLPHCSGKVISGFLLGALDSTAFTSPSGCSDAVSFPS
ncbi:zinc finger SWIM domain-containing protein 3 isoform X2 [Corvus cornix cornix]|uniref:zinc finger SWIM domain-containing protein 3 isoform X2 n=1 Tax=Corvus cornix cornix TaxID=932674 RepID=UPI001951E493|nr:zinc finger SWIM domain-containing protein 3 isoform X2 [Corvus cornix cornix]